MASRRHAYNALMTPVPDACHFVSQAGVDALSGVTSLQVLDLEETEPRFDSVLPLCSLRRLRELNIKNHRPGPQELAALAAMPSLQELRTALAHDFLMPAMQPVPFACLRLLHARVYDGFGDEALKRLAPFLTKVTSCPYLCTSAAPACR
jgi:hypothetical protein